MQSRPTGDLALAATFEALSSVGTEHEQNVGRNANVRTPDKDGLGIGLLSQIRPAQDREAQTAGTNGHELSPMVLLFKAHYFHCLDSWFA